MRRAGPVRPTRLGLVALEGRDVPATFVVTTIADSGPGSLRDAITQANNSSGTDEIVFNTDKTKGVDFNSPQTITLADNSSSELEIGKAGVTIQAPEKSTVTIERASGATNLFRHIRVASGTTGTVALTRLSFVGGNRASGGAIFIESDSVSVTLDNWRFENNTSNAGGAYLSNNSGIATTMKDCQFINNKVNFGSNSFHGGAVHFGGGKATLTNCEFDGKLVTNSDAAFTVGGAAAYITGGTSVTFDTCLFTNNAVQASINVLNCGGGGAVFADSTTTLSPTVSFNQCTFKTNFAALKSVQAAGGAVFLRNTAATFTYMDLTGNSAAGSGGGIYAESSTVTINVGVLAANQADSDGNNNGNGGGIFTTGGSATLEGVLVMGDDDTTTVTNNAVNGGGAFFNATAVTLTKGTTFVGNVAKSSGGGVFFDGGGSPLIDRATIEGNMALGTATGTLGSGGGIVFDDFTTATIRDSAILSNTSHRDGGGILFRNGGSPLIINSTISGNVASGSDKIGNRGGGICFFHGSIVETVKLYNSTIANNRAETSSSDTTSFAKGGGLFVNTLGTDDVVDVLSTIIDDNQVIVNAGTATGPDVNGTIQASRSLFGNTAGANIIDPFIDNQLDIDAQLGALDFHGGPTKTHSLKLSSPAIDNGGISPNAPLLYDQRHEFFLRGVDLPVVGLSMVDIGAYELQSVHPRVASMLVNNSTNPQRSIVRSLNVTFDRAITYSGSPAAALSLFNTYDHATQTTQNVPVTISVAQSGNTRLAVTFNSFVEFGSLIDGKYSFSIDADQVSDGAGNQLDGNSDGTGGDDFVFDFHRYFGDYVPNQAVDFNDYLAFRDAFGSSKGSPNYTTATLTSTTTATSISPTSSRSATGSASPSDAPFRPAPPGAARAKSFFPSSRPRTPSPITRHDLTTDSTP